MDCSKVTICSTCMDRNDNLCQAISTWKKFNFDSIIITDWCSTIPIEEKEAIIIRVEDQSYFWITKARNLAASLVKTDWIWFVDADVKILDIDFEIESRTFYSGVRGTTAGTCLIENEVFKRINGYSEFYVSSPLEDLDLYRRAVLAGYCRGLIPDKSLFHIEHTDECRTKYRKYGTYEVENFRRLWDSGCSQKDIPYKRLDT